MTTLDFEALLQPGDVGILEKIEIKTPEEVSRELGEKAVMAYVNTNGLEFSCQFIDGEHDKEHRAFLAVIREPEVFEDRSLSLVMWRNKSGKELVREAVIGYSGCSQSQIGRETIMGWRYNVRKIIEPAQGEVV